MFDVSLGNFIASIPLSELEAQLMLTNPRDAFRSRSVKVNKHGTIRYVMYGFPLVFYSNLVHKTHRF